MSVGGQKVGAGVDCMYGNRLKVMTVGNRNGLLTS
jgi:hypothetical protein